MQFRISGISIDVQKKNIKNIHLSVMPPDGKVRVSAPLNLSDDAIKIFIRTKIAWIKTQQAKFASQARLSEREYVSGESIFIFGKQYYLRVVHDRTNKFIMDGQTLILTVRETSTTQQRENYVNEKLRKMLIVEIEKRLPTWEKKTHLKCNGWQTKIMQSKWGSCNPVGKLWFNLHLAHTPLRCLDYVILHELLHLKVRHHNKDYIALLDKYMPFWQEVRKELNDFVLMPMKYF